MATGMSNLIDGRAIADIFRGAGVVSICERGCCEPRRGNRERVEYVHREIADARRRAQRSQTEHADVPTHDRDVNERE